MDALNVAATSFPLAGGLHHLAVPFRFRITFGKVLQQFQALV
jgi:hypothetical protein